MLYASDEQLLMLKYYLGECFIKFIFCFVFFQGKIGRIGAPGCKGDPGDKVGNLFRTFVHNIILSPR